LRNANSSTTQRTISTMTAPLPNETMMPSHSDYQRREIFITNTNFVFPKEENEHSDDSCDEECSSSSTAFSPTIRSSAEIMTNSLPMVSNSATDYTGDNASAPTLPCVVDSEEKSYDIYFPLNDDDDHDDVSSIPRSSTDNEKRRSRRGLVQGKNAEQRELLLDSCFVEEAEDEEDFKEYENDLLLLYQ
jgi:hypothetical protein